MSQISERISTELEKQKLIATYEAQVAQKRKLVDAYTADRAKLVSAGSEKRAQRHTELAGAVNQVRANAAVRRPAADLSRSAGEVKDRGKTKHRGR